jgi:hypothetical protein
MSSGQFQNILFDPPAITASRRDQRAFLLLFTGRCSAKSPHNRAGSAPQKSASVTSGLSACGSATVVSLRLCSRRLYASGLLSLSPNRRPKP